jgi:CHAT domain-containing protein/Flp pilus assembly protein TadD
MAHRDKGSLIDRQPDKEIPSLPLVITVRRQRNGAFYDLAEVEPLIQNIQIEFDEDLVAHLIKELKILTDSLNRFHIARHESSGEERRLWEDIAAKFARLGRLIYEQLLPDPIQKALTDRPTTDLFFRLEDSLLEVPWELAFDGEQFLSRRFRIGRQIITSLPFYKAEENHHPPSRQGSPRLLIICDPTESLPAAFEETESLAEALDQQTHLQVEIIGGKRASKLEVLSALSEFEIVHFTGHSTFDPADSGKSGWLLHDSILTTAEIGKISNPPHVVFSNSCQSAATQRWDSSNSLGQASLGIGSSFLLAGVRHYVGALWVIHDSSSARFAGTFYRRLIQGRTIGEALFCARTENPEPTSSEALMATGYVHYGRPDDKVIGPAALKNEGTGVAPQITRGMAFQAKSLFGKIGKRHLRQFGLITLCLVLSLLAFVVFRSELQLRSADPIDSEYQRGVEAYQKGNIAKALAIFQQLIKREDNRAGLGFGDLAEIYLEAGASGKAKKVLADAVSKPISSTMTSILNGHLAFQEGNHSEAEMAYIQALAMDNGLPEQAAEACNALGMIYFLGGNNEKAIDFFNKALSRQQTNPGALFSLGFIAYLDNAQDSAKDLMTRLLNIDSHDEMAQIFSESAFSGTDVIGLRPAAAGMREVILVGPFYLKGGTSMRLGYDWVFAHLLTRILGTSDMGRQYTFRTATPLDIPNGHSTSADKPATQRKLQGFLHSLGVKTAVFGDLELFRHVANANIKAMDVSSGTIIRSINLKAQDPRKTHKLAERLRDELAGSFRKGEKEEK